MTLKLTRANILRIKEDLVHLIEANPLPTAVFFVVIAVALVVLLSKNKSSA